MRNFYTFFLLFFLTGSICAKETTVTTTTELKNAIATANAGDVIWVSDGTFVISTAPGISVTRSGSTIAPIKLWAVEGSRPVFDFSGQTRNSSSARGLELKASYWHIKGIDFFAAGDNGLIISNGHYNTIEHCSFFECNDSGLQADNGASNNLVLNCDSYFNADATNENADGFAPKLGVGTNNTFKGCRSWRNLDDGFDGYLRGADNITTYYEECWVIQNGYNKSGIAGTGDGNGFKTGGSDDKLLKHNGIYTRCIAIGNRVDGFDHNSNRGDITLYNCAATANGTNLGFGSTNRVNLLTIKNTAVVGTIGNLSATTTDISNNSWNNGLSATATDYENFSDYYTQMTAPRKSDGSLPDITFWKLLSTSDLIDQGINVGLTFTGSAPDIGPLEYGTVPSSVFDLTPEEEGTVVSIKYYSVAGQPVDKQYSGVIIVHKTYQNGKVVVEKILNR